MNWSKKTKGASRASDPDPVFLSGSGSGAQIYLNPVSTPGFLSKKKCRKGSKSYLLEKKDRQKMEKATISSI